jgi:hypothetical protein
MKRSDLNEVFNLDSKVPLVVFNTQGASISVAECVERIKRTKKRGQFLPHYNHECDKNICNPETDAKVVLFNVYVCDYGNVHVCGEHLCNLASPTPQGEYVCPISGLVLGVEHNVCYQKEGEQAPYRIVKLKKKNVSSTQHEVAPVERVEAKTRIILDKLFFGNVRKTINDKTARVRLDKSKNLVERYVQQQQRNKTFVNLQEVLRIRSNIMSEPLPYRILAENIEWVQKCVHIIKQIWEKLISHFYNPTSKLYEQVKDAPVRPNVVYTVLALLYMMKTGHRFNEKIFVPYDTYVAEHAPREKDIPLFGYDMPRMKKSKDLLISFFQRSVELNMYIRVDEIVPNASPFPSAPITVFKPTVQGQYCKKCQRRYLDGNICQHMSSSSSIK